MPISDRQTRITLEAIELEAKSHPKRYALRITAIILLGYAYPFGILMIGVATAVIALYFLPAIMHCHHWEIIIFYFVTVLAIITFLAMAINALRIKPPPPDGYALQPSDAKELQLLINNTARQAAIPKVDRIVINDQLNAGVIEIHPLGYLGETQRYLLLGFPLLQNLTCNQLSAVLAHEFAHLKRGHTKLNEWAYRINQTWQSIAEPLGDSKTLQRIFVGWFADWYTPLLSRNTQPARRLHEYEADRYAADMSGANATAEVLCRIEFLRQLITNRFYPQLFCQAASKPVPPDDYFDQLNSALTQPAEDAMILEWAEIQRSVKTPITDEHPSLINRLTALGVNDCLSPEQVVDLIKQQYSNSAVNSDSLLGSEYQKIKNAVTVIWKKRMIERWRLEYAFNQQLANQSTAENQADNAVEAAWNETYLKSINISREEARTVLMDFLDEYPNHADANLALASLLLIGNETEKAIRHFELSVANDSYLTAPAFNALLDHYRQLGQDENAGRIAERLQQHEQKLAQAKTEEAIIKPGDNFISHDLGENDLNRLRRVLFRHPRINKAFLVIKKSIALPDKDIYVLLINRSGSLLEGNSNWPLHMSAFLSAELKIRFVVITAKTNSLLARKIQQVSSTIPIFAVDSVNV